LCCTQRIYAMRELKSVADACKCVNASQTRYSVRPGNKIRSDKGLLPSGPSSARRYSMGCLDQNGKGQNQYRRLLIHPFVQVTTEGHGGGRLRRGTQKGAPFLLAFASKSCLRTKGKGGSNGTVRGNQDAKTTKGSGELLGETAPMEKHPAPLTAGNVFARLAVIGVLLLGVVGAFSLSGRVVQRAETDARAVRR